MEKKYLNTKETAVLIRNALKKAFPGKKFSVRSEVYSGGSSINVTWTHGLPEKEVKSVAGQYSGAGFDGMIDYKYYTTSWLLPDGSTVFAQSEGTSDYRGYVPKKEFNKDEKPHPDAVLVHFGADFIFCRREVNNEMQVQIAKDLAKAMEVEFTHMNQIPREHSHDNWWNLTHKWMYHKNLDDYAGITLDLEKSCGHWEEFYLMVKKGVEAQ
jgi:hypothetical protein